MKSLADQLREKMTKPVEKASSELAVSNEEMQKKAKKKADKIIETTILKALLAYDNSDNKSMAHVRFDKNTLDLMNKFKMATNVDVTKFVAFAVKHFLETYPEIKTIIKQFIQNTDSGYNKNNILRLSAEGNIRGKEEAFIAALKNIPGVVNASSTFHKMIGGTYNNSYKINNEGDIKMKIDLFSRNLVECRK